MSEGAGRSLRLQKLPDRSPVKLSVSLTPSLHSRLQEYAQAYETAYRVREPLSELIPFMLERFLEDDKAFCRRARAVQGHSSSDSSSS